MQNNLKNTILLALIGVAIGAVGLVAYYQHIQWLLIACAIICAIQFTLAHFAEPMKDESYPYLATCFAVAYYLTDNIPDAIYYGACLYYATALVFLYLLSVISRIILLVSIVVPIGSLVAYFLHAEPVFIATATFCFVYFLVKHFRGKNPSFAMDVFLWCTAFGIGLLFQRDTDTYTSVKIIKGMLWGSAAYFIVGLLYAFYHAYIKKDRLT